MTVCLVALIPSTNVDLPQLSEDIGHPQSIQRSWTYFDTLTMDLGTP